MGLLDRLSPRKSDSEPSERPVAGSASNVFRTKALRKFLASLKGRESPVLLDLGPVVGSNVTFFGEQLGCKISVESIYAEVDRHARDKTFDALPLFFEKRFPQDEGSVDGILCWDLFDYLGRPAAQALAAQLTRLLRPDGSLFALFALSQASDTPRFTKFVVVDDSNLMYQPYAAVRKREASLPNREILRLFGGLHVADSFLLQNNIREMLFRKPA